MTAPMAPGSVLEVRSDPRVRLELPQLRVRVVLPDDTVEDSQGPLPVRHIRAIRVVGST